MNKEEFNQLPVEEQVHFFNDALAFIDGTIRNTCKDIGVAKTTVLERFKKNGYVYSSIKKCFIEEQKQDNLSNVENVGLPESGKNLSPKNNMSLDEQIFILNTRLHTIARSFIEIGLILDNIQSNKLYLEKGYVNITGFTDKEFGFSKNQTYNLISVARNFSINGKVSSRYKDFSFHQLVELLSIPEPKREEVTPDMTIKEIRTKKSGVKPGTKIDNRKSETINDLTGEQVEVLVFNDSQKTEKNLVDQTPNKLNNEVLEEKSFNLSVKQSELINIIDALMIASSRYKEDKCITKAKEYYGLSLDFKNILRTQ